MQYPRGWTVYANRGLSPDGGEIESLTASEPTRLLQIADELGDHQHSGHLVLESLDESSSPHGAA
jgi:hypothetical protein